MIRAIAQRRLRYWQASDAPKVHSLAAIDQYTANCSMMNASQRPMLIGKKGLATELGLKVPLRLDPYTKLQIEVHCSALRWFDPSKPYADKYMANKGHRLQKLYNQRHPRDAVLQQRHHWVRGPAPVD